MSAAASTKTGGRNTVGTFRVYGIVIVGLCVLNVVTTYSTLSPLLPWRRETLAIVQEEDYLPPLPASPLVSTSRSLHVATQMIRTANVYPSTVDDNVEDISQLPVDHTDPIFQRWEWSWDNDPVVIEKYKMLFFTVPKNSCTEWKHLFRRMMNYSDWHSMSPHDPDSNGLRYLGHYNSSQQTEFMTSPNWTRAIFVREPMERLLSGFLDKAYGPERYILRHCCLKPNVTSQLHHNNSVYKHQCRVLNRLRLNGMLPTPHDFPFQTFVEAFLVQCKDPHWTLQSDRITPRNWKYINFVGHFDSLEEDARSLLERIGAWQEYGATGWGVHGNLSFFQRNIARHSTSAKSHQEEFYTPQVLERVLKYLKEDYDHVLFNFSRPNVTTFL
jgi:hypothetical protein